MRQGQVGHRDLAAVGEGVGKDIVVVVGKGAAARSIRVKEGVGKGVRNRDKMLKVGLLLIDKDEGRVDTNKGDKELNKDKGDKDEVGDKDKVEVVLRVDDDEWGIDSGLGAEGVGLVADQGASEGMVPEQEERPLLEMAVAGPAAGGVLPRLVEGVVELVSEPESLVGRDGNGYPRRHVLPSPPPRNFTIGKNPSPP